MGQPLKLVRGDDELIVYGRAQAAVHIAQGWAYEDPNLAAAGAPADNLLELGVSDTIAGALADLGLTTFADVAESPVEDLVSIKGVGKKTAASLKAAAAELIGLQLEGE